MSDSLSTVTVYTRENCHLCEDAIEAIREVQTRVETTVDVRIVHVDEDRTLRERYGEQVPYVLVDGRPKFKYRVDPDELERLLVNKREP